MTIEKALRKRKRVEPVSPRGMEGATVRRSEPRSRRKPDSEAIRAVFLAKPGDRQVGRSERIDLARGTRARRVQAILQQRFSTPFNRS